MAVILGFIVLVASFIIVATLIMLVLEKTREIAVLKSMGAGVPAVMKIFVVEGLIIGAVGTFFGLVLGFGTCLLIDEVGIPLDPEVYYIDNLPVRIDPAQFGAGGAHGAGAGLPGHHLPGHQGGPPAPGRRPAERVMGPASCPSSGSRAWARPTSWASQRLEVLRDLSLEIAAGELVALTGPSGAGKSTFLHVLGTLDAPSAGRVLFDGQDVFALGEEALATFRNRTIGFVFQSHHLLPEFTALENAMMPALIRRLARAEAGGPRRGDAGAGGAVRPAGPPARRALRRRAAAGGAGPGAAASSPGCCWPTSRPATSTRAPPRASTPCCVDLNARLGITAVVVTHNERLAEALPRRLRLLGRGGWSEKPLEPPRPLH